MDTWWEQHRPASVLGTVLLVVGALTGAQLAVGAVLDPGPGEGQLRAALSPYRDGAFTVRAVSVDPRVDIATAEDGSYVLGHTPAGSDVVLDLDLLEGDAARPWWVEPATGRTMEFDQLESAGVARFSIPDGGGAAWVLVVDDAAAGYPMPDAGAIAEFVGQAVRAGMARRTGPGSGGGGDGAAAEGAPAGSRSERDGTRRDGADGETGRDADGDRTGADPADRSTGDGAEDGSTATGSPRSRGAEVHADRAGDAPASGSDPDGREFRTGAAPGEQRDERAGDDEQPDRPAPGSGSPDQESPGSAAPQGPQQPQKPQQQEPSGPENPAGAAPRSTPEPAWDRLAQCESSGDWSISTGNGYYGGLQFDRPTWSEFGGTAYAPTADGATREQQIEIATQVRDTRGGYGSWPACARKLGLPR